jgi:hypothetical protein
MTVTARAEGLGHRPAQWTALALLLAHGALPMDSREAMLTNAYSSLLWLPETHWQVEEVIPRERGR